MIKSLKRKILERNSAHRSMIMLLIILMFLAIEHIIASNKFLVKLCVRNVSDCDKKKLKRNVFVKFERHLTVRITTIIQRGITATGM